MVKNRYAKRRRNEWKSIKLLEAQGWMCFRTAGSHSDWDIIALHPIWGVELVQVKTNRKPTFPPFSSFYNDQWSLHIHVWNDYQTKPDVYNARPRGMIYTTQRGGLK
jgi:hypothetical protein